MSIYAPKIVSQTRQQSRLIKGQLLDLTDKMLSSPNDAVHTHYVNRLCIHCAVLAQCWASVEHDGPTLHQHRTNAPRFLGYCSEARPALKQYSDNAYMRDYRGQALICYWCTVHGADLALKQHWVNVGRS